MSTIYQRKVKLKQVFETNHMFFVGFRWSMMPNPKDYLIMNITSSAIDPLINLQTIFSELTNNLLKNVFHEIRARVIIQFDEFLFNSVCYMILEEKLHLISSFSLQVITNHQFNEGGASQFLLDINRGWSRIGTDHVLQLLNK